MVLQFEETHSSASLLVQIYGNIFLDIICSTLGNAATSERTTGIIGQNPVSYTCHVNSNSVTFTGKLIQLKELG